jgi:hypothetical protein
MQVLEHQEVFDDCEKLSLEVLEVEITSKNYDEMAEYLRRAKNTLKVLEVHRQQEVKPFLEGQREVQKRYKPYMEKLERTIRLIDKGMVEWNLREERRRHEIQVRLEMKARAEEERKRKELEERARKHEEAGRAAKAEILRDEADHVIVATPIVEKVVQPKGQYIKGTWRARIINPKEIPHDYLIAWSDINQGKVDKFAQATKGSITVPGVEFYEEKKIVTGAIK